MPITSSLQHWVEQNIERLEAQNGAQSDLLVTVVTIEKLKALHRWCLSVVGVPTEKQLARMRRLVEDLEYHTTLRVEPKQ